ncbi:hypothetical protein [Streptomyces sp. NPDC058583]|uniref:hypothetical protein n=1 Tax=unclassified Streptomyces TaxID=2593676 RepID=UPI003661A86E
MASISTASERRLASEHWLLSAAPDARRARVQWATYGVALLRCGGLFSAVRIPAGLVYEAAGTENRADVAEFLAGALDGGPIFYDAGGRQFYALAPASTAGIWKLPEAECLGSDSFLGVPASDLTEPDPRCSAYWSVPMDGPAVLCVPAMVARLVIAGRDLAAMRESAGHE